MPCRTLRRCFLITVLKAPVLKAPVLRAGVRRAGVLGAPVRVGA